MRNGRLRTVILTLVPTLFVLATLSQGQMPYPKQQNVPAEYQDGIAQLRIAKGYLEKAGNKWGGYRVRGIRSIDHALTSLGVSPEATPQEMQSGNIDEPGMMNSGISSLQTAKGDFERAGNNWGGRKARAVAHIDRALQDLQTGIDWAREHNTY